MQIRKEMDGKMSDTGNSTLDCAAANNQFTLLHNMRRVSVLLATTACWMFAIPAQCATVFSQPGTTLQHATVINSNAVTDPDGSDRDVTAFDSFSLRKPASITSLTWRGESASEGLAGFTIKVYASNPSLNGPPDLSSPLAEINVVGKAGEKPVGKNLSDYSAKFSQPLRLNASKQYWISIVSNRSDPTSWGWASGTGGDGKSIQSYSEFKILSAPNDRAFSLSDGSK